jgi:CofD-related protein of GAK system
MTTMKMSRPSDELDRPLRIVLFSGGSACRNINISLCKASTELTRIVPAWDSGGSSKVIREAFGMLPVGDIRQALMTMAHGEGRAGDVVKICNARLSGALGNADARAEFDYYVRGEHPLLHRMEPGLRGAILNYLNLFSRHIPQDFDFRNGSIGNFILAGAFLAHQSDINTAVFVFRKLCSIEGFVWPASIRNDIQLSATLKNGRELSGQHLVTSLSGDDAATGIAGIRLSVPGGGSVAANEAIDQAVAGADAIIFGPGSFYTSILPHLLVDGVGEAIAQNRHAPKIFVGNILECAETTGADLAGLIGVFLTAWRDRMGEETVPLTHVVDNRELFPFEKTVGEFRYLRSGELDRLCEDNGIERISGDFEDVWNRGQHDGRSIASTLIDVAETAGSVR